MPSTVVILLMIALSTASQASGPREGVTKGRVLFLRECAECHGADASGNGPEREYLKRPPADLRDGQIVSLYRDDEIEAFLRDGQRLRLDLRPEAARRQAGETEALLRFIRRFPQIDWERWEAGEEVYTARCIACHDYYGRPIESPPAGFQRPSDLSDPKLQERLTDEALRDVVRHGKQGMPVLVPRITDHEAADLVAYVRVLSPGYVLYDRYCLDCHGVRGEGGTGHLADALAPEFAFDAEFFEGRSAGEIRRSIWHMLREKNPSMPHFRESLTTTEVEAIIAHLRSLNRPALDPARGTVGDLTRVPCSAGSEVGPLCSIEGEGSGLAETSQIGDR